MRKENNRGGSSENRRAVEKSQNSPKKDYSSSPRTAANKFKKGGEEYPKKTFSAGGFDSNRPNRNTDRRSFGGGESFSDRPKRDFSGDRPSFNSDRPNRNADRRSYGGESSSDRPKRDFGDRPNFSSDRPNRNADRRSYGGESPSERPKRDFGDKPSFNSDRPSRSYGGETSSERPRRDFGDKPSFNSDRPKRSYGGDSASDRPKRDFGDRPNFSSDRPKRTYGGDSASDRPKRDFGGDKPSFNSDRPKRSYGGDSSSDRPKRDFGGDKPSFNSDRPKRSYGGDSSSDRPSFSSDRPKRTYGGEASSERPRRDFGDKPSFDSDRPNRSYSGDSNKPSTFSRGDSEKSSGYEKKKPFGGSDNFYDKPRGSFSKKDFGSSNKKKSRYENEDNRVGKFETAPDYNRQRMENSVPEKRRKFIKETDNDEMRLNRYIANAGVCSRRDADNLIATGQIKVNGTVITEMGYKVKTSDAVKFGNKLLNPEKPVYVILNKPKDYITTTEDPDERHTVMDLIKDACPQRIYPVGRLDRNTTGLLLLTNDGELAEKLMHPSNEIRKIYQVELDKPIKTEDFEAIQAGIELEDGKIKPDELAIITPDAQVVGIEIHSGKNRIVRRIFENFGYEVTKLDRTTYAGLTKKDLPRGKWRFLTEKEVIRLKYML